MAASVKKVFGGALLITGASSGIGEAMAREAAARGSDLVLVARRADRLQELAEALSGRHGVSVRTVPLDLTRPGAAAALTDALGDTDVGAAALVAGMVIAGPFESHAPEEIDNLVALNVTAQFQIARALLPRLQARDRKSGLLFVASTLGYAPVPYMALYAASKAFVISGAEALRAELKGGRVRIGVLAPGATRTDMIDGLEATIMFSKLPFPMHHPARVARAGLKTLATGGHVAPGLPYKLMAWMAQHVMGPRTAANSFAGLMKGALRRD